MWEQRLFGWTWVLSAQATGLASGVSRLDQTLAVQSVREDDIDIAGFSALVPTLPPAGDPMGTGSPFSTKITLDRT